MSATGFDSIDHTIQLTHIWINEIDKSLGWENKPRAFRLLRSVLHALRDWLPVNEAADLAAQLPTLVRGIYYDQWRPAAVPVKERSRDSFLARVDRDFRTDPIDDTAAAVTAVFRLLSEKVTAGEISDVRNALPADLRALWPAPAKAA
ncbi:MAG: DUF2267 domain-containing protein [Bradyrhizobiaceae bacterium]|nr:DUF2267 domain-containing protein [Bradyrhizobiaceae bacterium]